MHARAVQMYNKLFGRSTLLLITLAAGVAATASGTAWAQNQTSSGPPAGHPTMQANMTLESAKEQYTAVWNRTEFNATFSTFVEPLSAAGYGVYQEHGSVFRPGETIVLYVEPVAFGYKQIPDGNGSALYLMNMTADYVISSSNGTELQTIQDVPVGSIVSHKPNTELYLELTLTQAQPFPAGDYNIKYTITDEVSGKSFSLEKQIKVAETSGMA
jgi:hypothetical protein